MQMRSRTPHRFAAALVLSCALLVSGSCTLNPATGQRQLTLISEQQEIAMGRSYDRQIVDQLGLYPDDEFQAYIKDLGAGMAELSERPHLDWHFRILDDPTVNAFAVPGGYIYITRGMLAHAGSEAQLASVVGHEIGHVTARHTVEKLSRAQLAQLGIGIAMVASEEFREYAGLASAGLQVLFLKFSRDDERQADDLGLRYMSRGGFEPAEMPKMFDMLSRLADLHGSQRIPTWQSTHPDPDQRALRIANQIETLPEPLQSGIVNRETFLSRLDGMIFGSNPREGYTIGSTFYHPEMAFRIDFPKNWKVVNQRQAVAAVSPEEESVIVLSLAQENTARAAADEFFSEEQITRGKQWRPGFFDFATRPQTDSQGAPTQTVKGVVGFISHNTRIFRIVAYASVDRWKGYSAAGRQSLASFRRIRNHRYLDAQPERIEIVKLRRSMSLAEFDRFYPSTVDLKTLAALNAVNSGHTFSAGTLVKRVTGGKVPKK